MLLEGANILQSSTTLIGTQRGRNLRTMSACLTLPDGLELNEKPTPAVAMLLFLIRQRVVCPLLPGGSL